MNNCVKVLQYAYKIKTIDSHTMGEPTRIVYDDFLKLCGNTMMEKKEYLIEHYDFLRKALVLEPIGHRTGLIEVKEPYTEEVPLPLMYPLAVLFLHWWMQKR